MRDLRDIMAELVSSGLSAEQHLLVLELTACVAAHSGGKDEAAERRRQKDRERKRVRRIPQNSAESAEFRSHPPSKEVPPAPPQETQPLIPPSPPKGGSSPAINKPNGFSRFWEAYPNKVGKRAAELAYERAVKRAAGPDPPRVILAGVERARHGRKWGEGYIPNPATWLNQDRWLDEPETSVIPLNPDARRSDPPPSAKRLAHEANMSRALAGARIAAGRGGT